MRKRTATVAILMLIGTLSLWRPSAAEGPATSERDNVEARALLKAANEGLTALKREIDTGNVPFTPDLETISKRPFPPAAVVRHDG